MRSLSASRDTSPGSCQRWEESEDRMSVSWGPGLCRQQCTWETTLSREWKNQVVSGTSGPGNSVDLGNIYILVCLLYHKSLKQP